MAAFKLERQNIVADLSAGVTTALVTIPDGMASAMLAGVNPIHGLYALMTGTPIAALLTSSHFMYVSLAGAISVTASVLAGFQSIDFEEVRDVWDISWPARLVMLVTFVATLVMPVHYAVFLGVALSLMLFVYRSSTDIEITEITTNEDGDWIERPAPAFLHSYTVTQLEIYGSVFFASAQMLEKALPSPAGSERTAVVMCLRGRQDIGSTFILVLEHCAARLRQHNGKLFLAGVSVPVKAQIDRRKPPRPFPTRTSSLRRNSSASPCWMPMLPPVLGSSQVDGVIGWIAANGGQAQRRCTR